MKEDSRSINIRAIQHYMYCPRRFALLEVNDDWAENSYVVKANLLHENVHDGEHEYAFRDKIVKNSVVLFNDEYDIFGIADSIEFVRDPCGVLIPELEGKFRVRIVEYKPKPPKDGDYHESDAIQVFAQKICVDSIWDCNCEAFLYYGEKHRRVLLPFSDPEVIDKYSSLLKSYLEAMRIVLKEGDIPTRRKSQRCAGCSLSDLCFPKSLRYNVRQKICEIAGGEH